jgi:TonB family protein
MNSAVCFVASFALNAAWQVPLLAGAGFAAGKVLRRWGPEPQHVAWVATLLLSSVTPALSAVRAFLPAAISFGRTPPTSGAAVAISGTGTASAVYAGTFVLPGGLIWLIFGLYASLLGYFAARMLWSIAAAKTLVREATSLNLVAGGEEMWEQARRALGTTNVRLLSSQSVRGVVTTGVHRPVIILPAAFAIRWTADDLLSALGHEVAHVRRGDYAKNLLYEAAGLLTAFHPVTWMVKARIARTREMICDAMVVERIIEPGRYRQSLLRLAEHMLVGRRAAGQALGMFDANILEERIMMMRSKRTVPNRWVRGALTGCATMLLVAAAIGGTAFAKGVAAPSPENNAGPNKVYKPGPGITDPVLKYAPDPEFPKSAKVSTGFDVICLVGLVVDREGMPENVHVIRSTGKKAFDTNAMKSVRQYRFKPALRHGEPVAVAVRIEVNFRKY